MKKQEITLLTLAITLSIVGIINAQQAAIEEKQPSFSEALEFFKQKAANTTEPIRKKAQETFKQAKEVVAEKVDKATDEVQKMLNDELQSQIDSLSVQLQEEQEKTAKLRSHISEAAQQDTTADTAVAEQLAEATQETAQLQKQVMQLQEQVANLTQELRQKNQTEQEKDNMIAMLEEKVQQASSIATPAIPASAPPLAAAVEVEENISVPAAQPNSALQEHLAAIRAGMGLKPVKATEKKQPEKTGMLGAIAAGLQSRFGWMFGQEEPEDEWDNEVEDFIQSTP